MPSFFASPKLSADTRNREQCCLLSLSRDLLLHRVQFGYIPAQDASPLNWTHSGQPVQSVFCWTDLGCICIAISGVLLSVWFLQYSHHHNLFRFSCSHALFSPPTLLPVSSFVFKWLHFTSAIVPTSTFECLIIYFCWLHCSVHKKILFVHCLDAFVFDIKYYTLLQYF